MYLGRDEEKRVAGITSEWNHRARSEREEPSSKPSRSMPARVNDRLSTRREPGG